MGLALGNECYSLGEQPCNGSGQTWTESELDEAISGPVSALVFDNSGKADIKELLASVVATEFAQEQLAKVLAPSSNIENWRVGEAIAEAYLTEHRNCLFPWPDGRDERKSGSSLPGADLVGIQRDEYGDRFAFGEVKTSAEKKYPPSTLYGRTGLKQQLEDLRDKEHIRDDLFKYLAYRVKNTSWVNRFQAASIRYLTNKSDVHIFGILIRDVPPHADDIRARVERLSYERPEATHIELLALYLPTGTIKNLSSKSFTAQTGANL